MRCIGAGVAQGMPMGLDGLILAVTYRKAESSNKTTAGMKNKGVNCRLGLWFTATEPHSTGIDRPPCNQG
jgi:hypothetical protein